MKQILLIIPLILSNQLLMAQNSWTVKLNNKILLTASKPEEAGSNTIKIKQLEWRKNRFLEVTYNESIPSTWIHSFYFCDENEEKSLTKDSLTHCKIAVSSLRKIFAGKKEIKIYMIISPPNPMMGAPSRRILLCTLLLP